MVEVLEYLFFLVTALIILGSAIAVIALPNPVHSTISLIVTLVGVAVIFAMLGAHFLSVVQIIVYAGAIVVLVLFVVMLLSAKTEVFAKTIWLRVGLAAIFSSFFVGMLIVPVLELTGSRRTEIIESAAGTVENLGSILFTRFLFPFEIASLLIMAALIGAVMIAGRTTAPARKNNLVDSESMTEGVR